LSLDHKHLNSSQNILVAFFLNATFAIVELIGGYFTNSVAIYSDALHDLGDSLALLFAYYSEKYSQKSPDSSFTFGYKRFSVLAALVNGLMLLAGSIFVIYESVLRLSSPEIVKPEGMLLLAIIGIIINSVAAYRLSKDSGLNQKMVMYHLLEDIMGWIAVFIVSIVLLFKPWYLLDSILSILISMMILRGVYKNILKVLSILLQKFPDELEIDKIEKELSGLELIENVHAFKGWSLDSDSFYLRFHVRLPEMTTMKEVDGLKFVIKEVLRKYNVDFSSIEFESSSDKCDSSIYECKD